MGAINADDYISRGSYPVDFTFLPHNLQEKHHLVVKYFNHAK